MLKQETSITKEAKARIGDLHISPRKVRLVADLIKTKSVAEAQEQLRFVIKKAARPVLKLLNSAVASAQHNFQLNPEKLVIKSITVNQGRTLTRYKPRAQGRAFPVRRRTSIVEVILVENPKLTIRRLVTSPKKVEAPSTAAPVEPESAVEKPQVKPKEPPQPKKPAISKLESRSKIVKRFVDLKRRLFNRKTNA